MQNSPYLFSSKAWQAQRQNSLCLFARLSLPLRPQKPRNITMFLRLVLQHRCINRAHLPEGGFKWNGSCNSFLSTEQLTTAEHPFCTLSTREWNIHSLFWSTRLYRDFTHISMQISNQGAGGEIHLESHKLCSSEVPGEVQGTQTQMSLALDHICFPTEKPIHKASSDKTSEFWQHCSKTKSSKRFSLFIVFALNYLALTRAWEVAPHSGCRGLGMSTSERWQTLLAQDTPKRQQPKLQIKPPLHTLFI